MKHAITLLAALLAAPLTALYAAETNNPNILVILADDLGYADIGAQGCTDIPTPNIDSLAKNGVRFTSGYVTSSMCSPSRAGLLTGRSQSRFGHEINWEPVPGTEHCGLPLTEKTMADQLKAVGYRTGIVGKWHLGESPQFHPNKRGFEEFFGFVGGGHGYFCDDYGKPEKMKGKAGHYHTELERNGQPENTTGYLTTVLGRKAAGFIHSHKDQPWFLYAAFNAPHTPLQATPELLARVKTIPDEPRRTYAAMVVGLDDAVGEILRQLRADGLEERTLIFFLSDNGGPLDRNGSRNDPLRGEKGMMWEGGIRVPFLTQWKGVLPAGKTYDRPVSSLDILPTALAQAGAKSIAAQPLDGVDILPYLKGARIGAPHEHLFWRMKARGIWAVRQGDDKLVMQKTRTPLLMDLAGDIAESTDLTNRDKSRRDELQKAYDTWANTLPEPLWGVTPENSNPGGKNAPPPAEPAATRTSFMAPFSIELIGDPHGQRGVKFKSVNPGPAGYSAREEGILRRGEPGPPPIWELMQAYSKQHIDAVEPVTLAAGQKRWTNACKEFILGHGTPDADFVLGVNSIEEYGNQYRSAKAPWPHLLLEQKICAPGGHVSKAGPSLADCQAMMLQVSVQLRYARNLHERSRGYSESKHAAQFQLFFTLQNLNRQSPGYGKDYVWFGVPFYDDRHPVISPSYMRDGTGKEDESKGEKRGTGRFINSVGTKPFAEHGLIPGEWLQIRADVLPLMVEALERAWSRGFCNSSTNLADYKIGSMNIGWEVPGLSAVSAQIKDLSLLATGPKAEK